MSLWETIDELLDDSSSNVTHQSDDGKKEQPLSDQKIYDENELDPNELLGLEYEDDDLGLLGDQMETVEEKPERETSKIEIEQSYREIPVREDEKPIKNNFSQSSKPEVKKTYEKTIETLKSPVKQPRSKTFKARTQVAKNVKNYPKNDGILPIPTHFLQPANVPQPNFNMPMIYPQMSQFSNLHYNFNEMFGRPTAPFTPNPYRIYDQGFVYQNYSFQNQPSMNNFPSEMIIPPNQFSNPTIHTQYSHFKANNIPRNPKYASEPKATKSDLKEDVAKKTKSSRSRKELDLLLEKRLAQLEKERIEEEKIEQSSPKRKSEHCEKHVEPEAKSESESLILAHDPDYIKKMEEQKRKREEILRQKEEKRNQRIKQMNSKNENIPEEKTKVQTSSDNRIIKATSKRLIALNSTDKKIFDMSNSLGVRAKENKAKKDLSSKRFYIGTQLSKMAQVTEADHLYQFDKVYQVVQNSETDKKEEIVHLDVRLTLN